MLAALGAAHRLLAFNSQPAHRPEAGQAGKRSTVTGGFPPAITSRRLSGLLATLLFLLCQVAPQNTDSQLSMRVFWKRGEGWRSILGTEVTP